MKKKKLKRTIKILLTVFILIITISASTFYFLKTKDNSKKEPQKIDYVSLITQKLDTMDADFIKWVDKNYSGSLEKLAKELEKSPYNEAVWHKVTGASYKVLTDLYQNKYESMGNITLLEKKNEETLLSFVGDVSLADNWYIMPKYDERGKKVYGILSEEIVAEMQKNDVMAANSEFTVSNRGSAMPGKLYTFRAKPERLSIYNEMGVNLVTLANNHVYDFGQEAFLDMLNHFDEIKMPRIGAGKNLEEASRPYYFVIDGYKYAFLNSTRAEKYILTPGAEENSEGVFRSYDTTRMIEKIKEVKQTADFVITIVHFGKEGSHELEEAQITSAKQFIDAGSDAVVGHHAHTLQGFEFYNNKIIAYNLGNFIFNAEDDDTAIFQIKVDSEGNFEYYILPANQSAEYTKLLTGEEKERVINNLNSWSINATIDSEGKITEKK